MGIKKYDIFISYRRIGGEATARIICERLTDLGYSVFFDVEALRSGDFNTKLYSVIEECNDFLVILSPDSLDRCKDENDWVRLEIVHAIKHGKNIIPVMLRGFKFPIYLPEEIDIIRYKSGIEANSEFFDAFIDRLKGFLKTKTTFSKRIWQNTVFKRTLPFIIALFITAGTIFGGMTIYNKNFKTKIFPSSQEEKNITNEVLDYVGRNLTNYNLMIAKTEEAYKACGNYLINLDTVEYENVVSLIEKSHDDILKIDTKKDSLKSELDSKVDKTPIKKDDLIAVNTGVVQLQDELLDSLQFVNFIIGKDSFFDTGSKKQILAIYMNLLDIDRQNIVYATNGLLLPIDNKYLTDFKRDRLTLLTSLPFDESKLLTENADIENQLLANMNKYQELINKLSSITGNINADYSKELADYREQLKKAGLSDEEIDERIAKMVKASDDVTELKKEILESEDKLLSLYEDAKEKFKPLETDKQDILWGKMLRFLNLGLSDDAIKCVQMYHQKVRAEDKYADTYVPAVIEFIKNIKNTGINYGVIVIGYEPNKTQHEIYKIGDIIIAVNGKQCLNYTSYAGFKISEGDEITLLRRDSQGKLATVNVVAVKNQSKVLLMELTEKDLK